MPDGVFVPREGGVRFGSTGDTTLIPGEFTVRTLATTHLAKQAVMVPWPSPRPERSLSSTFKTLPMNPYRPLIRPLLFATIILLAGAAVLTLFRGKAAILGMLAGSTLGACTAIATLTLWYFSWRADAHLAAFERGVYLAHWTYEAGEWRAHLQQERENSRYLVYGGPLIGLVLCGIAVLPFWKELGVLGALGVVTSGVLVGWGLGSLALARAARQRAQSEARVRPQAYIGKEAALLDGRYISWAGAGLTLTGATLVPGPPVAIELAVRVNNGRVPFTQMLRIPVPVGRQQEAERVIQALGF